MGEAEDSILQVRQVKELKQTKSGKVHNPMPAPVEDTPARKRGRHF